MSPDRSIITWPQKTPVCLRAEQDNQGKGQQQGWLAPHTLDWRKNPSETLWSMALHQSSATMTRRTYLHVIGGRSVADGVSTVGSNTVTSATAAFGAPDIGEPIAGPGIPEGSTIVTVTDVTAVLISETATATSTAVTLIIGSDPASRRIRLRWEAPPTSPKPELADDWYLRCYDTTGHQVKHFAQAVGMLRRADPAFDRDRAVFAYVTLDPAEDGSTRVALRCACHGRWLQLDERFQQMVPRAELLNENGVALVVGEPVLTSWVEVLPFAQADKGPDTALTAVQPAVDYRSRLVNPTSEVMEKGFTFTHAKETTGTWSNELGLSLTVGASVEVGVEAGLGVGVSGTFKASAHWETTAQARRTWGQSDAETQTVQDATTVRVPPHTALNIHIQAARNRVDVPFQYVVHRQLLDGTMTVSPPDRGVYRKVETLGTTVEVLDVEQVGPVAQNEDRS
ncbi:hypothetical protein [Ornithinimicrobium sp. LYQ103]|uniref:hypothetical protein n=1 Tax=Ornithinimicrobium sp. LYQ103 TaxID=3378796 RepID=UPI00386210F6